MPLYCSNLYSPILNASTMEPRKNFIALDVAERRLHSAIKRIPTQLVEEGRFSEISNFIKILTQQTKSGRP